MPKLGSYDDPDLNGIVTKVEVMPLQEYLIRRHGEKAPEIIDKFSNVERDNIIFTAEFEGAEIEGFFMIPGISGWHNSNLKSFLQLNGMTADVDTDDPDTLKVWLGAKVKGVLDKTSSGTFLRLAK